MQSGYCEYKMNDYESWGSYAVLAWSDDTNEELEVAAMANLNLIKTQV